MSEAPKVGVFIKPGPDGQPTVFLSSNVDPHATIRILAEGINAAASQLAKKEKSRITPARSIQGLEENN